MEKGGQAASPMVTSGDKSFRAVNATRWKPRLKERARCVQESSPRRCPRRASHQKGRLPRRPIAAADCGVMLNSSSYVRGRWSTADRRARCGIVPDIEFRLRHCRARHISGTAGLAGSCPSSARGARRGDRQISTRALGSIAIAQMTSSSDDLVARDERIAMIQSLPALERRKRRVDDESMGDFSDAARGFLFRAGL